MHFRRPYGTLIILNADPALKRRAIFDGPYGTGFVHAGEFQDKRAA